MTGKKNLPHADKPATLKMLAEHLDLSPATVSIVLNNSPVATSIPAVTKQRVHAAAKKFNYRPNLHARMLRSRLTHTIGIIAPELSEGYFTGVMLGVCFEPELIVRESTIGVHKASPSRPSRGKR